MNSIIYMVVCRCVSISRLLHLSKSRKRNQTLSLSSLSCRTPPLFTKLWVLPVRRMRHLSHHVWAGLKAPSLSGVFDNILWLLPICFALRTVQEFTPAVFSSNNTRQWTPPNGLLRFFRLPMCAKTCSGGNQPFATSQRAAIPHAAKWRHPKPSVCSTFWDNFAVFLPVIHTAPVNQTCCGTASVSARG